MWPNQQSISSVMALVTHSARRITTEQAGMQEESGTSSTVANEQLGRLSHHRGLGAPSRVYQETCPNNSWGIWQISHRFFSGSLSLGQVAYAEEVGAVPTTGSWPSSGCNCLSTARGFPFKDTWHCRVSGQPGGDPQSKPAPLERFWSTGLEADSPR